VFDRDGDEKINAEELSVVLEAIGRKKTIEEVSCMIEAVDDDKTGEIEYAEFLKLMTNEIKAN
jgi:calmodulin